MSVEMLEELICNADATHLITAQEAGELYDFIALLKEPSERMRTKGADAAGISAFEAYDAFKEMIVIAGEEIEEQSND